MVDALAFHQDHGEVCPAGWNKGDSGMKDTPEGVAEYLSENADNLEWVLVVLSARAVFSAGVYVYGRCDWRVITS